MNKATAREATAIFSAHLVKNGLKRSAQREAILEAFLRAEKHLSVDDLYSLVHERHPEVGRTTIYRTLKLLTAAGLASELPIDGQSFFEREYGRQHHDHLVCRFCGEISEFHHPEIERLQEQVTEEMGFTIEGHRHQIFGRCRRCARRRARG
jgi:Fur family transcriptional regulator, ferric uptake regulator